MVKIKDAVKALLDGNIKGHSLHNNSDGMMPWEYRLKYAIVRRAYEDYYICCDCDKADQKRLETKKELLAFFHSDWYNFLCDFDAETTYRILREIERKKRLGLPLFDRDAESEG